MTGQPEGFVAVRLPLEPGIPLDPFALCGPSGILFQAEEQVLVGLGTAFTIPLPGGLDSAADLESVTERLRSVPCEDRLDGATGPRHAPAGVVGFGALPFQRWQPAALVVPEITYGADAFGNEWVTIVAGDPAVLPSSSSGLRGWLDDHSVGDGVGPVSAAELNRTQPHIAPLSSDDSFEAMVAEALLAIDRGDVVKVVLARQVEVTTPSAIGLSSLLRRWHALEPTCAVFAFPSPDGQFVGASPELLIERTGLRIHSRPLAGTTDRVDRLTDSVLPDELLASAKDGNEHRLVVEAIEEALHPFCDELDVPDGPDLVHLHNITHLGTSLTGSLRPDADGVAPTALQLVGALHPTPAVGGVPSPRAVALIDDLEPQTRGNYAGPVGYVDASGDGRWMIGIRAMSVRDRTARLAAGVGIVRGSIPHSELVEANLKLTAVFDALAPGLPFSTRQGRAEPPMAPALRTEVSPTTA